MTPRPWTDDEVKLFLQLRKEGFRTKQIAAQLNRSTSALDRKLRRMSDDVPRRSGHFQPAAKPKHVKRAGKTTLPPLQSTQ
jgi:IS30 family transposase